MNIGRAVRLCRSHKGWTLKDLSGKVGVEASYLSKIENGKLDTSISLICRLSTAFSIPLTIIIFIASDPTELAMLSEELKDKLSRSALDLLGPE